MSGPKLDVIWSPVHHDKFIVWGSDITLYQVARLKEIEKKTAFTQISTNRGATVLASQSANGVRAVDVSAITEQPEPLLALGHSNGRVILTALKQSYDPLGLVGREFNPRHQRLCNSVSWSHVETNMLAVGMEKHRSDHCILLWDVNRGSTPHDELKSTESTSLTPPEPSKPVAEMGLSDTAHNISWSHCANRTLLASMNLKYIKIFDLRELSNKGVLVGTSRYCYGACSDPFSAWQLASRGENVVCVWDARAFTRPLLTLPQPRHVHKIQWCPTRRNLLLSLQRDSNTLRLHDIQQANNDASKTLNTTADSEVAAPAVEAELEEYERGPSVIERDVAPAAPAPPPPPPPGAPPPPPGAAPPPSPAVAHPLASFSWHPAHEARLLAVNHAGGMCDYTVCERVTVAWGCGALAWSCGGGALRLLPERSQRDLVDISHVMRRRALTDYGLKPDLWQNADLADDEALSGLWHFLALSKSLVEDGCIRNSPLKHPGVRSVLRSAGEGGYRSECVPSLLPDLPHRRVTIYRSAERTRALQLCGWGWGWENAAAGVERCEAEGTPCRAAALAAFHLRLRHALDVLARAREPQLRVVALALAGLSDERLWRDALAAAAPALPDAYLRALLRFLAASGPAAPGAPAPAPAPAAPAAPGAREEPAPPDLDAVLAETEMRLEDRVAFACVYLSDAKLHEYVRRTADELAARGDLCGVLLTGAGAEGVALLQRWAERTGDVQSAALVAARCLPPDLLREPRPPAAAAAAAAAAATPDAAEATDPVEGVAWGWIAAYRSLLDAWRLWGARSALDTCAGAGGAGALGVGGPGGAGGAARRVAVACSYCGKSVATPHAHARARPAFARLPPPAAKMKQISSCPNCRKPLPRCGVCSLHLGGGGVGGAGGGAGGSGGAQFGGWFSWCVACRHGGHAAHLLEWFKEHTECPVSSCNCHCSTLDPPDCLSSL